jgi:hypothetical protein
MGRRHANEGGRPLPSPQRRGASDLLSQDTFPKDYEFEFIVRHFRRSRDPLGLTVPFQRSIWQSGGNREARRRPRAAAFSETGWTAPRFVPVASVEN